MLDWLTKSAWTQGFTAVIQAVSAEKSGKELALSVVGINRLTGIPTSYLITHRDIPKDVDLISPKLIPIIMGNHFLELTLYSLDDNEKKMIISVKRSM